MRTITGWPSTSARWGDTDTVVKSKAVARPPAFAPGVACADGIPVATVTPAIARAHHARSHRPGVARRRRNQEFGFGQAPVPSLTAQA